MFHRGRAALHPPILMSEHRNRFPQAKQVKMKRLMFFQGEVWSWQVIIDAFRTLSTAHLISSLVGWHGYSKFGEQQIFELSKMGSIRIPIDYQKVSKTKQSNVSDLELANDIKLRLSLFFYFTKVSNRIMNITFNVICQFFFFLLAYSPSIQVWEWHLNFVIKCIIKFGCVGSTIKLAFQIGSDCSFEN